MFCSRCGTEVVAGSAFCSSCGARATNESGAQAKVQITNPTIGKRQQVSGCMVVVVAFILGMIGAQLKDGSPAEVVISILAGGGLLVGIILWFVGRAKNWYYAK